MTTKSRRDDCCQVAQPSLRDSLPNYSYPPTVETVGYYHPSLRDENRALPEYPFLSSYPCSFPNLFRTIFYPPTVETVGYCHPSLRDENRVLPEYPFLLLCKSGVQTLVCLQDGQTKVCTPDFHPARVSSHVINDSLILVVPQT